MASKHISWALYLKLKLTLCKEQREGKPQCSANLILPWAPKIRIELVLQKPNNEHCVQQDGSSYQPHVPGERLRKHQ